HAARSTADNDSAKSVLDERTLRITGTSKLRFAFRSKSNGSATRFHRGRKDGLQRADGSGAQRTAHAERRHQREAPHPATRDPEAEELAAALDRDDLAAQRARLDGAIAIGRGVAAQGESPRAVGLRRDRDHAVSDGPAAGVAVDDFTDPDARRVDRR